MSRQLHHFKLGHLCTVKHGYPFDGSKFENRGDYIVLTPGNFFEQGGFKRIRGKEKYYSGSFPHEYLCSKGDLIVAMTQQAEGLLGSTALVPEDNLYLHNQRIGLISHTEDLVDKLYLYYLFMTKSVRKQLSDSASGTKIRHTSPDKIYSVSVFIPDIATQKKNALLLYSIDKKIANNCLICAELEAMAKTLYDYWFTQFDFPNEEGKPYRSSGGEMVWNERLKREIPKGWEVGTVATLLKIDSTSVDPKKLGNTVMEHYSIPAFDENHNPAYEPAYMIESGKYYLDKECILTSKLNPRFKRLWDPFCDTENTICSTEFIVYRPLKSWMRPFCYAVLDSDAFYAHMTTNAIASTGSRKRIQPDVSAAFALSIPDEAIIRSFIAIYGPILEEQKNLYKENRELQQLRDWLLPMLMNGQARVE